MIQEPAPPVIASAAPTLPPPPDRPPLNINGILLEDGPKVDPTDIIPLVRARVTENTRRADVKLLAIHVHRAHLGKVDLDDKEAFVTYAYLVTHRDPRVDKAHERKAQRVELTLRSDAPALQRQDEDVHAETVPEPTCVWNAAWRAAIASGLSGKDHMDVRYGRESKRRDAAWIFTAPGQPDSRRVIDGQTCAIRLSKEGP